MHFSADFDDVEVRMMIDDGGKWRIACLEKCLFCGYEVDQSLEADEDDQIIQDPQDLMETAMLLHIEKQHLQHIALSCLPWIWKDQKVVMQRVSQQYAQAQNASS